MHKTLQLIITISLIISCNTTASARKTQGYIALDSLDKYVENQTFYQNNKEKELNRYKKPITTASPQARLEIIEKLVQEYRHVDIDSTLHYCGIGSALAQKLNDEKYIQRFELHMCTMLPIYGIVKEAIDRYEAINPHKLSNDNLLPYLTAGDLIYNYAKDFYPLDEYKLKYVAKANAINDSLLSYINKDAPEYTFYQAVKRLSTGSGSNAINDLKKLLKRLPIDNRLYARTAAIIGNAYINDPYHTDDAIYFLAQSAISDIATANRETTSLHRLGKLLYDKGDIDRSYSYLTLSLATAVSSGSRLRSIEIAEALPLVFKQVKEHDTRAKHTFIWAIAILSLMLLIVAILFFIYNRNRLKLKRVKEKIAAASELKDSYIRQILSLCGIYLTALESFNLLAGRKIKAGQQQDLLNMIESGRILRDQLQTFYDVFDSAFLMIYPNFVDQVNALLERDKQIVLKDGERMSPEIRILAFMRLGVDDSSQISKFLGLSLNTIYTYRNKIKNRSIDREHFEENIKNIGSIS